jgi:isopenicillin-N epimerase
MKNFSSGYSKLWGFSKDVIYLNHGSFGACPVEVLKYQKKIRNRLEREPMKFFIRESDEFLYNSKKILADFVGADNENLVFVPNVTSGVNTVLKSLKFKRNSHILITDHIYFACKNTVEYIAAKTGVKVDVAHVDFPVHSSDKIIEQVLGKVNPLTSIALIDHVTSPTGIVFPVKKIVEELNSRGIDTIIDGAHSPGMLPLNVDEIGAAYFTGNCHKWICSPKGAGFLYVRPDKQKEIFPLTISHLPGDSYTNMTDFQYKFSWGGTQDVSAYICVGKAIKYIDSILTGGWNEVMVSNRNLALKARRILCDALNIDIPCPDNMIGTLASLPLPDDKSNYNFKSLYFEPVYKELIEKYNIEAVTMPWPQFPKRILRVSAQLYNSEKQYKFLASALKSILKN